MWRKEERSLGTSIRATFDWDEGEAVYILVGQKGSSVCDEVIMAVFLKMSCNENVTDDLNRTWPVQSSLLS